MDLDSDEFFLIDRHFSLIAEFVCNVSNGLYSAVLYLTLLPSPPPPPSLMSVEGFHMGAVMAWRMYTVKRVCRPQHGAWLAKMEGGPVSHATRLVAILTLVCLCVRAGGRADLALVFLHTLAV